MTVPPPGPHTVTERAGSSWEKWAVLVLLAYSGAFALVAPVTNYDSQVYNMARLCIAHSAGGLFGNKGWNTVRQIAFPWTFDAIHYPCLFLHWGYGLPSFACLTGILVIVFRLVAACGTAQRAWRCCLALTALPTLVFQATITKNDIPVVFAIGCWYYAWRLWRQEQRGVYVLFMALALSFAAGAKSSGLPFFVLLGGGTLWQMRSSPGPAIRFSIWIAVFFVSFGGVEIYLNNWRVYHAPLGPPAFIAQNRNRDGVAGGTANFIRYCFGNMDVGIDAFDPTSPVAGWLESACLDFERFVGLPKDIGYRSDFGDVDANMHFLRSGGDSDSDFGPIGALALLAGLVFVLALPRSDPVWKLAATGVAVFALTSYTVAWMVWNARFLMLAFCLFTLALTLWLDRLRPTGTSRFLQSAFSLLVIYSAVAYPCASFNRKPVDLWRAIAHRPAYEMKERLAMLEITSDIRRRASVIGSSVMLLQAGGDSWVFCIMELRGLHVLPVPVVSRESLLGASRVAHGALPVYLLTLNTPVDPTIAPTLRLIKNYGESESALYEWRP